MSDEEWRPVVGHEYYEVSNLGRVRSLDRMIVECTGKQRRHKGRVLRPATNNGYHLHVVLGRGFDCTVHVLACLAFHGPKPTPEHECAHEDGDGFNNVASNLSWKTHAQNEADKERHGTRVRGETVGNAVLSDREAAEILWLVLNSYLTQREIADMYGTSQAIVNDIKFGRTWAHVLPIQPTPIQVPFAADFDRRL